MRKLYMPLEVDYYQHRKFDAVSEAAELLFIRACCLSKSLMTDGLLTRPQLLFLGFDRLDERIAVLVAADLWVPQAGAWQIKGYLKRNASAEELEAADKKRRDGHAARTRGYRKRKAAKEAEAGEEAEATGMYSIYSRTEVDHWNAAFPDTAKGLRDELQDQNAFRRLMRDEDKTASDFAGYRSYLERSGDIKYWPRPADLVRPTKQGTGQEAWAVIEQRIAEEAKPEAAPTQSPTEYFTPAWEEASA